MASKIAEKNDIKKKFFSGCSLYEITQNTKWNIFRIVITSEDN